MFHNPESCDGDRRFIIIPRLRIIYRDRSSNSSSNPATDQKGHNDQHDRGNQPADLPSSIPFLNSIWWHNVVCRPRRRRIILRLRLSIINLLLRLRLRSTSLVSLRPGRDGQINLLICGRDNFGRLTRYSRWPHCVASRATWTRDCETLSRPGRTVHKQWHSGRQKHKEQSCFNTA
jgi:hypothetical protein